MTTPHAKITGTKIDIAGAAEPGTISMSFTAATRLLEVLQTCDEFLRTAPRPVWVELARVMADRPQSARRGGREVAAGADPDDSTGDR